MSVVGKEIHHTLPVADPRRHAFDLSLTQPLCEGDKLALWLPDADEDLQSLPAYSIRLANQETTWTSGGYNVFYTF